MISSKFQKEFNEEPNADSTNIGQESDSSNMVDASLFSTDHILARSTSRYAIKDAVGKIIPLKKFSQSKGSQRLKPLNKSLVQIKKDASKKIGQIDEETLNQDTGFGISKVSSLSNYRVTNRKWAHGSFSKEVSGMLNQLT